MSSGLKCFEEKKCKYNDFLNNLYIELGDTQLLKEADKVMNKTKMSMPEPPQEVE